MRESLTGIGLMTSLAFLSPVQSAGQTPGTYRVWLCAEPCAPADSVGAVGIATIVVVDDSTAESEQVRYALGSLPLIGSAYEPAVIANACFQVTHRESHVGGEELHFGIKPVGATRTRYLTDGSFSLRMYSSVDAGYSLRWNLPGPLARGEGWSYGWRPQDTPHRNAYFAAVRIGDADLTHCME